ncbi:MAG: xanthine dehydrogenase accessory protein XdhC [Rhodothalassiaceae bacterium]
MTIEAMRRLHGLGPFVLLSVVDVKGSAPRGPGAHMLVTDQGIEGTIGGGRLEYDAIREARRMLKAPEARLVDIALGPALDQCCGGRVMLMMQSFDASDEALLGSLHEAAARTGRAFLATGPGRPPHRAHVPDIEAAAVILKGRGGETLPPARHAPGEIGQVLLDLGARRAPLVVYGAGHVGRATVPVLKTLPLAIDWIDDRADGLPAGARHVADPVEVAAASAAGSFHLVFTQSHPLDYAIVRAVLKRGDAAYCGLIGSETKRARFLSRLRAEGIDEARLARLTCPIGAAGPQGKEPEVIAIAVAAELIGVLREKGFL